MIKFLAQIFRGFHYVIGISLPLPGMSDRTFVFMWLGILALLVAFCLLLLYAIPLLYFG